MSLDLYTNFDKQGVIDIMKQNYGEKKDLPDSAYYNMAVEMFPEMNLPEWGKIVDQPTTYTSNPDDIDLSPDHVNTIYGVAKQSTGDFMESMKAKVWDEDNMPPNPLFNKLGTGKYERDTGSLMQALVEPDSWVSPYIPDKLKKSVMIGLNNSFTGRQYATENGKELYDTNFEDYDPNFGNHLASIAASMSDPAGIANMYATFVFGGSAHKVAWQGLKNIPKIVSKWWQKSTGRYIVKSIPKTKTSSGLRKTIQEKFSSDAVAYGTGGFGTFGASMAAQQSARDQRMNYGKYSTNNGTINRWDIINDAWDGYKEHATTGFLLSGVSQTLGLTNMWANAKWKMGAKNYKTFAAKAVSNPASSIGIQGTIFTTAPMVLNEDIRKEYYDPETGEFDFSKFVANVTLNSAVVAGFWGLHKLNMPKQDKTTGLYKRESFKYDVKDTREVKGEHTTYSAEPMTKYDAADPGTAIIPRNRNIPRTLESISTKVVKDIKHETNKSIDLEYTGNESAKLLTQSISNIKKELGPETPFEFFEKDIDVKTEPVETVQGLKTIKEVVDNTLRILNKAGTKNKDGDYVGFDLKKISGEDIAYISTVMPTVVRAYQGYKLDSYETDTGRAEYIKRFQSEENGGRALTDAEKKTLLKAQEIEINRYDILSKDLNTKLTQGLFKSEQTQKITESELDEPMVDIVATNDAGNPINGDILTVPKEEADAYVKQGKAITKVSAEKQNMRIGEVESMNHGQVAPKDWAETNEMIASAVEKGILRTQDVSENIPKNQSQYKKIIKGVKGDELEKIPELKNKKAAWSNITEPYDVKILKDNFSGAELATRLPPINKILGASGKRSITELTQKDVTDFLDNLKKTKPKIKGIEPNMTSNITIIFNELRDKGFIKTVPLSAKRAKEYTSEYNELMKAAKVPLPELKAWYKGIPAVKQLMKNDKAFVKGVEIIETYPIRAEEIGALRGRHIVLHQPTGQYYIDLTQKRPFGAAKARGVKRPVAIPKELALELQKLSGGDPNKLLFPGFTTKLTGASKKVLGNVTSKAYKKQEKTFAERKANLSLQERDVYNVIAGHAEPKDPNILAIYKEQENWGDLFKLQEHVIQKVAMAKQEFMQEPSRAQKAVGAVQKGLTSGLSIKDVSGKEPEGVIKMVEDDIKGGATLSDGVKKKLVSSVNSVFNELTKDMTSVERKELKAFYAANAGIDNPSDFKINKHASEADLALFADEIIDTPVMRAVDRKNTARRYKNITKAREIFEVNDYNEKAQSMLLHKMFFPERDIADVNLLELSHKQSTELLDYMDNSPYFKEYDAFDYVSDALNVENIGKLSRQLGKVEKRALQLGFHGTVQYAFPWLAKRLNAPELIQVGQDLIDHGVIELTQGAKLKGFEESVYKILYEDSIEKGKTIFALRQGKEKIKHGLSRFNKEVKDNIWSLHPERYEWLANHAKKHPEDKVGVERFKKAKKFYDKIYDKDGNLKIDTIENDIAKSWYEYTQNDVWGNIYLSIRSNMTEAGYESFIKRYPLKEISEHFFVPLAVTQEFLKSYDVNSLNLDKQIKDFTLKHAQKLAEAHYGRADITPKELDKFMDKGRILAHEDIRAISSFGLKRFNPKNLIRRKMYLGERLYIAKDNKWIDAYEHQYDKYIPNYAASTAKLIANLSKFPYLVQLPGFKTNKAIDRILLDLSHSKGDFVGNYIHDMISSRTGLSTPGESSFIWGDIGRAMQGINKYISRANLTRLISPTKNFLLGFNNNFLAYDAPDVLHKTWLAMSFANRVQAEETGMMGLSYAALTEGDKYITVRGKKYENPVNKILDVIFNSVRFPTTEAITRLSSIYLTLDDMVRMTEGLRSSKPEERARWLNRAKDRYALSDRQVELLTKYGLSPAEVDWKGKESITAKGVKAKRLQKVQDDVNLQRELDVLWSKMITMGHTKTQGSTTDIWQPQMMLDPVVKGVSLYNQLAISATYNTINGVKENYRNGNWHRTFAYHASIPITAGILGYGINQLIKGAPPPDELETKKRKKVFNMLKLSEYGGALSFFWRVLSGQPTYGNPVFPMAAIQQGGLLFKTLMDAIRAGVEKVGIEPDNLGGFGRYFVRNARYNQSPEEFMKSVFGIYDDYKTTKENQTHPYKKKQNRIEKWEKYFYDNVKPISSKPEIVSNTIMTGYYKEVKDAFEMSDDFNWLNEVIMDTWWARYGEFIKANYTPDGAAEAANNAIEAKLLALNPILNGIGAGENENNLKWFDTRTEYLGYLMNVAREQGNPENTYLSPILEQEVAYKVKIAQWEKQFPYWLRQNYKKDDYKKYWSRIHPESWTKLGLPDLNP
jgi:hypothetical protein